MFPDKKSFAKRILFKQVAVLKSHHQTGWGMNCYGMDSREPEQLVDDPVVVAHPSPGWVTEIRDEVLGWWYQKPHHPQQYTHGGQYTPAKLTARETQKVGGKANRRYWQMLAEEAIHNFPFTLCTSYSSKSCWQGCSKSCRILLSTLSPSILGMLASITNSYLLWGLTSRRVMLLDIYIWSLRFFSCIG